MTQFLLSKLEPPPEKNDGFVIALSNEPDCDERVLLIKRTLVPKPML